MKGVRTWLLSLLAWAAGLAWAADASSSIPPSGPAPGASATAGACILTLRIEVMHWSLNPLTWFKDSRDASRFELPTLASYCSQLKVGQLLSSEFRWGSYLLHGSTGDTQVWVDKIQIHPDNGAVKK